MKQKIYSLAVTSHIHEVSTEVMLFTDLKAAQAAMKENYDALMVFDKTNKKLEHSIEELGAYICDEFCEDVYVDWTIEEHELNVDMKFELK